MLLFIIFGTASTVTSLFLFSFFGFINDTINPIIYFSFCIALSKPFENVGEILGACGYTRIPCR